MEWDQVHDSQGRVTRIASEERQLEHFIRAYDGRLSLLKVQVYDDRLLAESPGWQRIRTSVKQTPLTKVLYWTWSSTQSGSKSQRLFRSYPYVDVVLKWLPSCASMLLLFCIPQMMGGEIRNNGFYDPVRERDRYYSKTARNPCENDPQAVPLLAEGQIQDRYFGLMDRPLRPRFLCFLTGDTNEPYHIRRGDECGDEYVFVSYTRKSFCVDPRWNRDWAARDRSYLTQAAVAATAAANKSAFWIDFEGIPSDDANPGSSGYNEDVYRICDVVRGACSLVVINGPPCEHKDTFGGEKDWLRTWSSRLWVLPELLLAPTEAKILVYTQRRSVAAEAIVPEAYSKKDLVVAACSDAREVRQLVDHYSGNTLLTPLELVQLALHCLRSRTTTSRTNADLAYALKGLLRRRPQSVREESGFEAFASLSLANDSQRLLERLICTLPPDPRADWSDMRDAWGMQLWDIEPSCQVAGIVDDRTVLLDGAYGASIRWNRLETVAFIKRDTAYRTVMRIAVRASPALLGVGIFLTKSFRGVAVQPSAASRFSRGSNPGFGGLEAFFAIGLIILIVALIIIFASPYLLYKVYLGKFWSTQAWFLGIEGPVDDLAKLERSLFGFCENRLTWSSNSSLLSRHGYDAESKECKALPPDRRNIQDMITKSETSVAPDGEPQRQQRLFTLVDTYSLTVTQFYAYYPPTTVIICGQEGGMQRAVLCSYDWKSQTYCRETVLRMKTLILERMFRIDRFRFAMSRPDR